MIPNPSTNSYSEQIDKFFNKIKKPIRIDYQFILEEIGKKEIIVREKTSCDICKTENCQHFEKDKEGFSKLTEEAQVINKLITGQNE